MPVLLLLASIFSLVASQIPLLVLNDTTSCTDPFNITSTPTTGTDVASSFKTNAGLSIKLGFVYIKSKLNSNVPSSFSVSISSDDGAVPSRPLAVLTTATSVALLPKTSEVDTLAATFSPSYELSASTTFWVVVSTVPNLPLNSSLCGATIPPPANSTNATYGTARYIFRSSGSAWSDSIETTPLLVPFSLFSQDVTSSSSSLSPTTSPTATPSSSSSPSPTPSPTPSLTASSTETPSNSVTTGLTPSQSPSGTPTTTPTMSPTLTVNFTAPTASHTPAPKKECPPDEKLDAEGVCVPLPPKVSESAAASLDAGAVIAIILTLLIVGGIVACCISPSFLAHFARFFLGCRRCLCNSESSAYPPEPVNNFNVKNPLGAKV